MENKKKSLILFIIGLVVILVVVIGATYAYFQSVNGNISIANINVTAGTVDSLSFIGGDNITLEVKAEEFKLGGDNQEGTTNVSATLIANDTTNETEDYKYNIYLEIIENNLEYSSYKDEGEEDPIVFLKEYDKTLGNNVDYNGLTLGYEAIPELFLTVKGPDGYEGNIEGLNKATLKDTNDSYDITELREGIYPIVEDYVIKVNKENHDLEQENTKTDKWEITITFKNLETNQELNTGKSFKGRIRIQEKKIANDLMDVCNEGEELAECIKKLHDESEYGASNLIYHDGKADYEGETNANLEANDKSYRYTGSFEKVNNYICLGTDCNNKDNLFRIIGTFGSDGIKVVKADYANKELLGAGTTSTLDFETADPETYGSYFRANPYQLSTGTLEEQDAFTHRYKGLLDYVDRYYWQEKESEETPANWETSLLNKIHLNKKYLSTIDETYRKLILEHNWIYGNKNATWGNIADSNAKTTYDNEVGSLIANPKTDPEKIGLLYVSDYLYGAAPRNWNKQPYVGTWGYNMDSGKTDKDNNPVGSLPEGLIKNEYRSSTDSNWLYMGLWEWLITIYNDRATPVRAFRVEAPGFVSFHNVGSFPMVVRPTFYISNDVQLGGGTGTISNPYTLVIS